MKYSLSLLFGLLASPCCAQLDASKPYLGLSCMPASAAVDTFKSMGMPSKLIPKDGLLVLDMVPSAALQGAQALDIIQAIDGRKVVNHDQLQSALSGKNPGDRVEVRFKRYLGAWRSAKGDLTVTTERDAAYDSLAISGSQVNGSYRAEHVALGGEVSTLSPIVVVQEGKTTLLLKIRWCSDGWLFIEKVALKCGSEKAAITLNLLQILDRDQQVLRGRDVKVMETITVAMPDDIARIIRDAGTQTITCRVDGKTEFIENDLGSQWQVRAKAVIDVYDDIVTRDDSTFLVQRAK